MDGRTDGPTDETIFGRERKRKKKKGGIIRQKREGTVCSDTKPLKKSVFLALSIMHVFRRLLFKILFSIISKRAHPIQKNGFPILPFFFLNLQEWLKNRHVSITLVQANCQDIKRSFEIISIFVPGL
jgi:hypothetical protein